MVDAGNKNHFDLSSKSEVGMTHQFSVSSVSSSQLEKAPRGMEECGGGRVRGM